MSPIRKAWQSITVGLKNAALRFGSGGGPWWGSISGRSRMNYSAAVGDGSANAIIEACVSWLTTAFLEAPPRIRRYGPKDTLTPEPRHPLIALLRRPNPYFTGRELFQAVIADQMLTGNGYIYLRRSAMNRPVELWWMPSWCVEPMGDGATFITHYQYTVDGHKEDYRPADVVHFPERRDPRNPRKGLSKLGKLLREIYTDDEAATFTAAILSNLGIPGLIISPADEDSEITPDQAEQIKADARQKLGGDLRGEPMVLSGNVKVSTVSFSPEQMTLRSLRQVPEERISAVFGTPAVLVGLGAGLEHSIYNNYSEAREAAFEEKLIPIGKNIAERIMLQLVPEFDDPTKVEFDFDTSEVRVLQEDTNAKTVRVTAQLLAGGITVDEYREEIGKGPLGDQFTGALGEGQEGVNKATLGHVVYVPTGITVTRLADLGAEPEPAPPPMPLLPPGLADEGGEDEDQPTELRRVASAIRARQKSERELLATLHEGESIMGGIFGALAEANGNGHTAPALIGEG